MDLKPGSIGPVQISGPSEFTPIKYWAILLCYKERPIKYYALTISAILFSFILFRNKNEKTQVNIYYLSQYII